MKIVIDICKEDFDDWCIQARMVEDLGSMQGRIRKAIAHGTLLTKGHGRLIDADAFIATLENTSKRQKYKEVLINDCLTVDDVFKAVIESLQNKGLAEGDTPTIIEADEVTG